MVWSQQWSYKIDGTELNDHVKYVTVVPELQNVPQQRVILAPIDGDYPVFIRTQPMEGSYTFLIAMKNATDALWDSRLAELVALFSLNSLHTLTVQARGMASARTVKVAVEAIEPVYKNRTVVVATVSPKPVLV